MWSKLAPPSKCLSSHLSVGRMTCSVVYAKAVSLKQRSKNSAPLSPRNCVWVPSQHAMHKGRQFSQPILVVFQEHLHELSQTSGSARLAGVLCVDLLGMWWIRTDVARILMFQPRLYSVFKIGLQAMFAYLSPVLISLKPPQKNRIHGILLHARESLPTCNSRHHSRQLLWLEELVGQCIACCQSVSWVYLQQLRQNSIVVRRAI